MTLRSASDTVEQPSIDRSPEPLLDRTFSNVEHVREVAPGERHSALVVHRVVKDEQQGAGLAVDILVDDDAAPPPVSQRVHSVMSSQ